MTAKRIQTILAGFVGKRILVVGDVMLDQYVYGRVERLNPEAPVPVLHAQRATDMTGGAGNVAKNVVSLGAQAALVAVVGKDDTADDLTAAAQAEGYTLSLVVDESRPTTRKMRYMVNAQQLLRVDWEETSDVVDGIADQMIAHVDKHLASGVDAIIVSDYAKGAITKKVAKELLALARKHDLPLAADVKPSRSLYFKGATLIAPNIKEAHEYLGLNHLAQGGQDVADLAAALHKKFLTDVFLTMSAGGVYVHAADGTHQHVPQEHAIAVADTSGAGDTSLVAMLLARLAGATSEEMAEIANAAGAVVVSKVGAVGVTREEVENMMLHHHEKTAHE
jgi:rfaE bifunctional protein kinase chain/domain